MLRSRWWVNEFGEPDNIHSPLMKTPASRGLHAENNSAGISQPAGFVEWLSARDAFHPKTHQRRSLKPGQGMRCGERKPRPRGVHEGGAKFCGATRASCGGALEGSLDLWRSIIDSGKAEHYFELFAFFGLAFVAATGRP